LGGASVVEFDNKDREGKMASSPTYQGSGNSLEDAVKAAHAKIPTRDRDSVVCRVLQWGYHRGGYVEAPQFYALVSQDNLPELLKE
jgi:hypothetical protein